MYNTLMYLSGFPNKFGLKGFIFGNKCGATVKQGTRVWSAQTKHFAHHCTQSSGYCIATDIYFIHLHVVPGNKYKPLITQASWFQATKNNYQS